MTSATVNRLHRRAKQEGRLHPRFLCELPLLAFMTITRDSGTMTCDLDHLFGVFYGSHLANDGDSDLARILKIILNLLGNALA